LRAAAPLGEGFPLTAGLKTHGFVADQRQLSLFSAENLF
jgi:hypothetical protein